MICKACSKYLKITFYQVFYLMLCFLNDFRWTYFKWLRKKIPSVLFKNNINITVADAYKTQTLAKKLRIKRVEKVIGFKIGSVQKQTQKNYGFSQFDESFW